MRKKDKQESPKVERQLKNLSNKLSDLKDDTKDIRGSVYKGVPLLESEIDASFCDDFCIFTEYSELCKWYKENKCSSKCKGRVLSYRQLGVDSRKIKYSPTEDEIALRKKLRKYLSVAEEIDEERVRKEKEAERERKKKQVDELAELLLADTQEEEVEAKDVVKQPKYSNLKSLI